MFTNQECMGRMVGGAAIGVAVGMVIQKILSPRLTERPPRLAESASPKPCECAKKSKNLQVSSHHRKKHCHSRSKSAGDKSSKHLQKRSDELFFPKKSLDKSNRNSRQSDRRLRLESHVDASKNNEESNSAQESTNAYKFMLDTSTQYLPIMVDIPKGIAAPLLFDINNRKIHSNVLINRSSINGINNFNNVIGVCETQEKNIETNSYGASFPTMSTEYRPLPSKRDSKTCEETIPLLITNNSDLNKLGTEYFLTLPTFNESVIPVYTEYNE